MVPNMFAGKRVHLMGIGGCGVGALVPLLQQAGAEVSGCDLARVDERDNCALYTGHDASHAADIDILVHTTAVDPQHEELRAAQERGLPVFSRAACLAELMRGHKTVAIAGSHGKTTTTWMLGHILMEHGRDPVVMVGGSVPALGMQGGRAGSEKWFIAEVDESDGGFSHVDPTIAVVLNIEAEHLDYYGSEAALRQALAHWLQRVPAEGCIIAPADGSIDDVLVDVIAPVIRCGINMGDVYAEQVELAAHGSDCNIEGHRVHIPMPGLHNVSNAVCAYAAAQQVMTPIDPKVLAVCGGVRRRFTIHGTIADIRVVEDYAHHPTEIRATIAAALLAEGQVHVVFQPHRYTRTQDCFDEFITCFTGAQTVALLPIWSAGEEPIPNISARRLAEELHAVADGRVIEYTRSRDAALACVLAQVQSGDTILVLGAGDVGALAPQLCQCLQAVKS